MKQISYETARVSVEAKFREEGSVPDGTVQASTEEIHAHLEIESEEDPELVRELVRVSENGCWVLQSIQNPVSVATSLTVNGKRLS